MLSIMARTEELRNSLIIETLIEVLIQVMFNGNKR